MKDHLFFKTYRIQGVDLPKREVKKTRIFFHSVLAVCLTNLMVYNFYITMDFESFKSVVSVFLVVVKFSTALCFKEEIIQLFKDIEEFWNIDIQDEQLTFLTMYPVQLAKFYKIFMAAGTLIFSLTAFFSKNPSIFSCYIPPEIPLPLFFLVELYFLINLAMIYPSYNMLICHLMFSVTVQFRLLNLKIQAIDLEGFSANGQNLDKCVREMKKIIKYHQRLIRFADGINYIFSISMGCLFVAGVSLLCVDMYILSSEAASLVNIYGVFSTSVAMITEFFIVFGLPAQLMMDQMKITPYKWTVYIQCDQNEWYTIAISEMAEDTANTIYYECKWFLPNLIPVRKFLIMMIMRSQKSVCLTALNYHVINKQTIVLMLKTAYSFFTFLQTTVT